jgi:hypothetical protein
MRFFPGSSVACVHFGDQSSLKQLTSGIFSGFHCIIAITIPSTVKRIENTALRDCNCLRIVQFELPSQCWHICTSSFLYCSSLKPISLPSSVAFINCEDFRRFPFIVNGRNFLIEDDCLVRTNGRELIRYLGSSQTFCVSREITVLTGESFRRCNLLRDCSFDLPSRLTHLLKSSFSDCSQLCFIEIPKSVCFIGESCFCSCCKLTKIVFESPAIVRRIESQAFCGCESLISFTVPSSVSSLGRFLFYYCSKMSSVTFDTPSQLT